MLKVIANLTRPTSLKALTGFLTPGRNYCAAKDEGNARVIAKLLSFLMILTSFLSIKIRNESRAKRGAAT